MTTNNGRECRERQTEENNPKEMLNKLEKQMKQYSFSESKAST